MWRSIVGIAAGILVASGSAYPQGAGTGHPKYVVPKEGAGPIGPPVATFYPMASGSYGFTEPRTESKLEELLAAALRSNPDIRLAESKLSAAEAELQRARLTVMQKLTALYAERQYLRTVQEQAVQREKEVQELVRRMAATPAEMRAALAALQKARADLEVAEAGLRYLTGATRTVRFVPATGIPEKKGKETQGVRKPTPQVAFGVWSFDLFGQPADGKNAVWKYLMLKKESSGQALKEDQRRLLDRPLKLDFVEVSLKDLLDAALQQAAAADKEASALNLFFRLTKADPKAATATFQARNAVPLGAVFQWAEDEFDCRFVVRDYGIVAVDRDAVPPGAVLLVEAWKHGAR